MIVLNVSSFMEMNPNAECPEIYKIGIFTNYIYIRHDYNKHLDAL